MQFPYSHGEDHQIERIVKKMGSGKEICCFITCIGQPSGPVDFSDLSLLTSLHTMEGEVDVLSSCRISSFNSKVGMLDKSSKVD